MTKTPLPWPTHGRAKETRDTVAENQRLILLQMHELRRLVESGDFTRLDLMITINRVQDHAGDSLARLIEQGAPYRPPEVSPEE